MADRLHRRTIARLSVEYLATSLCEGVAESGLDILDYAIVLVVSAGSVGRLNATPAARAYDHGSDAPVPPELMAPTSLLTIEESLHLPADVARTRVETLTERGILTTGADGGYIMGAPVTSSNTAGRLADKNVAMAKRFVKQLTEAGVGV